MSRISLAASSAERWSTCTISPIFIADNADKIPEKVEDGVTAEGTIAHGLAALELVLGVEESDLTPVELQMLPDIRKYVDFCRSRAEISKTQGYYIEELVEHKVSVFFFKERDGFIDHCLIEHNKKKQINRIYITDLKYGYRKVSARNNKQMAIYAKSLLHNLPEGFTLKEDTLVAMAIYQPRANVYHPTGHPVSLWNVSLDELDEFLTTYVTDQAETILEAKRTGDSSKLKFAPSEHACLYCPAAEAGICKAHAKHLLGDDVELTEEGLTELQEQVDTMIMLDDEDILDPKVGIMLVRNEKQIIKMLEKLRNSYFTKLSKGEKVPGLALGQGQQGNRKYRDPLRAEQLLAKYLTKPERTKSVVISPSEADALLKDKELTPRWSNLYNANIERSEGGLKVMREEDVNENDKTLAQMVFEDLTDNSSLLD